MRDLDARICGLGARAWRVWTGVRGGEARVYSVVVLKRMANHSQLLPKQVECFFGDARNSCRQRQTRTFWVTWLEAVK